jgi:hypothetical protein
MIFDKVVLDVVSVIDKDLKIYYLALDGQIYRTGVN